MNQMKKLAIRVARLQLDTTVNQINIFEEKKINSIEIYLPGRTCMAGFCSKAPEIVGMWNQYSYRIFLDLFLMISGKFLRGNRRNLPESTRKNPTNFRREYLLPIPSISSAFLQDLVIFSLLSYSILPVSVTVFIDYSRCFIKTWTYKSLNIDLFTISLCLLSIKIHVFFS